MIDPFTERLRARSTADERVRTQAEVGAGDTLQLAGNAVISIRKWW